MSNTPFPKVLYHYTTQEGLLGILDQKALWATKMHFLNDSSELSAPLEDARIILSKLKDTKSGTEKNIILKMLKDINSWRRVNLCVCSFCEEGDHLSQWRAYGTPGSAYAIGFDPQKLMEGTKQYTFHLNKCRYFTLKEQKDFIAGYIDIVIEKAKPEGFAKDFVDAFIIAASHMKNEAFKEEKEWRLVSLLPLRFTDINFKFRPGKSMIVPYYSLPIEISCIKEIVIGPSPHPELVKDAVKGLTHKYNLKIGKGIKASDIPYRNW